MLPIRCAYYFRGTSHYYGLDWYAWCVSTGKGDLTQAWTAKKQRLRARRVADGHRWNVAEGIRERVTGDAFAAQQQFERVAEYPSDNVAPEIQSWAGLMAAVTADRANKPSLRDKALRRFIEHESSNPICVALAELLLQGAGQGKITAREFEALVENDSETDFEVRNSSASIVGYYLWTHGRKDKAVELWKTPARTDGGWNKILSCPVLSWPVLACPGCEKRESIPFTWMIGTSPTYSFEIRNNRLLIHKRWLIILVAGSS
jgi:hypothetical protein